MAASTRSLWPRLLLLGDSLTEMSFSCDGRWGAMLADSFQRRCDVIARGFSGYNTRQWQSICRDLPVASLQGDIAVLWLGANDASHSPLQKVPLEEYRSNLAYIVNYLKSTCGVSEVVMLTPPPADTSAMEPELAMERSGELTAQYADACKMAAEDFNVKCIDLHTLFKQQSEWQTLLSDGLHLSKLGAALVHSAILPELEPLVARFTPQNMDRDDKILPLWRDAGNFNPAPQIKTWIQQHPLPHRK